MAALTPFDAATVRAQVMNDLDPDGAAERLADFLDLPSEARFLLADIIREAANTGYNEGHNDGSRGLRNRVIGDGDLL